MLAKKGQPTTRIARWTLNFSSPQIKVKSENFEVSRSLEGVSPQCCYSESNSLDIAATESIAGMF